MIFEIRRLDNILFLNESTVEEAVTGQYFEDPLNVKNFSEMFEESDCFRRDF